MQLFSSPLNPSLFFTPNLSLIKLNLSVSCLSWHSKVTHSIISPFYPVKFTFLHLHPDGLRFQYVLGRTEDDVCASASVCQRVATLWMTSFRGAIKRACPWAVELSFESPLERNSENRAGGLWGHQKQGDVTECVMWVCIQFKSQIWWPCPE